MARTRWPVGPVNPASSPGWADQAGTAGRCHKTWGPAGGSSRRTAQTASADSEVRPGPRLPALRPYPVKIGEAGPEALTHSLPADFVLAKARLTLRSSGAQNFRFWVLYVISHPRRWRRAGRPGRCGLSARLSAAMLWPIPHCLPAPSQQPPCRLCARRAGHCWSAPGDSSSAFGTIGRSRTPISSGSRASRLTSVSGFHQVDSMGISDATFRQGLVGSTWPGGCAEPLSSAWPAVSLVGAGA